MNKLISFIFFSILFCTSVLADNASSTALNLLNRQGTYVSDSDILGFLRTLVGDTISFNITAVNDINFFTKEIPDTIWIKKRPIKNPQKGKHYRLSYLYKGEPNAIGEYHTPTTAINSKKFGVLSVDYASYGHYYYSKKIFLKLIDMDDLSVIDCSIPNNFKYNFTISSNKFNRELNTIIGNQFYVETGYVHSKPQYSFATLIGGEQTILFDGSKGDMSIHSDVILNLRDKDGNNIDLKNINPAYKKYHPKAQIMGKTEYEDMHNVRIINSDVDYNLAKSDLSLPFNFKYILAECKNYSALMSQTINPEIIYFDSWASAYKAAPRDQWLFVGGSLKVKDQKFLKMILNGKAFFMRAEDIKLSPEDKSKLDSLESCSPDIQNLFWNKTLVLCQAHYYNKFEKALKEVDACSKYGLAIQNWGVYDESEYTNGRGIHITFFNPTEQVIKYISFTFQGYNAVDDPYGQLVTKRCVGPIESKQTASYKFEYVWLSDVVEYAKIRSITVTYKNGSTKTISNPKAIMLSDNVLETIFTSNPVEDFK